MFARKQRILSAMGALFIVATSYMVRGRCARQPEAKRTSVIATLESNPNLVLAFNDVFKKLGNGEPKIVIVDDPVPNAEVGLDEHNIPVVTISKIYEEALDYEELESVAGHEGWHAQVTLRALRSGIPKDQASFLAGSKEQEAKADEVGAKMGSPRAMIASLEIGDQQQRTARNAYENTLHNAPFTCRCLHHLGDFLLGEIYAFVKPDRHESTPVRIERLRKLRPEKLEN